VAVHTEDPIVRTDNVLTLKQTMFCNQPTHLKLFFQDITPNVLRSIKRSHVRSTDHVTWSLTVIGRTIPLSLFATRASVAGFTNDFTYVMEPAAMLAGTLAWRHTYVAFRRKRVQPRFVQQ